MHFSCNIRHKMKEIKWSDPAWPPLDHRFSMLVPGLIAKAFQSQESAKRHYLLAAAMISPDAPEVKDALRRAILKSKYKTLAQDALSAALIVGPPLHLGEIPVGRLDWLLDTSGNWDYFCTRALLSLYSNDPDFKILADLLVERCDGDFQPIPYFGCGVLPLSPEGDRILGAMLRAALLFKGNLGNGILWQIEDAPPKLLQHHFDALKKLMRQETDTARQAALCWIFARAGKRDAEVADWARRLVLGTQYRTRLFCLANVSPSAKERNEMFAKLLEARFDTYQ